ncbi:MAG: PqqD family peptide modification chaperone, partial [Bacteroidota bacterium]
MIDTVFPIGIQTTSLQAERRAHEGFAASRRRGYLPNRAMIDRLDHFVASDNSHLLITGVSGSGKSALVAFWTSEYRRRNPDVFVISHHVGATMNSETEAHLLRRIMLEIREKTGMNDEIPSSTAELREAFPIWLAHASQTGLLLIIDGANQIDNDTPGLRWLPAYLPPRIHAIVTTTDVTIGGDIHMEPLSMSERLAVGTLHLEGRGKIDQRTLAMIAREESSSNPLFLRTRLEELHFSGLHNQRNPLVDRFLAARDLPELFALMLERLESDFGGKLIGDMLGAIWGARRGLTEGEIEKIVGCSRLELSEMLAALDLHLLRDDGRLRLFHEELRGAVERRYLNEENERRDIHIRIAGYFREDIPGRNRTAELLWQYRTAGELNALRDCLRDIGVFRWLLDEASHYELFGYWRSLENSGEMGEVLRRSIDDFERNCTDITELASILNATGDFLRSGGCYDDALPMLRRAVALREQSLGTAHPDTARSYYDLASLLQSQGELRESEDFYRRALSIYISNGGEDQGSVADTIDNLASVLCVRGEYDEAEILYRRGLRIIERLKGVHHQDVAANINNLAGLLHDKGVFDEAERLYRRALAVWEKSLGADHPFRAVALNNLGAVLHGAGRAEEAEELYRSALAIWDLLDVPQSLSGLVDRLTGKYDVPPRDCESDTAKFL